MVDSFEDLFKQIIQCEQRVENRQRLLTDLREQVQTCKDTLHQASREKSLLQNELLSKVEHHSDVELNRSSLETRESILVSQKETLLEEKTAHQRNLTSTVEDTEEGMLAFCQKVEEHSEDLDLTVSGQKARQNKASDTLKGLLEKEQNLMKEIRDFEVHKENISQLEAERYCQQQSLCDMVHSKKELEDCLKQEEVTLRMLEEERQNASKTPSCSEEFRRLRNELTSLSTESLEQQCSQLQQEAHVLQQQLLSRQQQQLRLKAYSHQRPPAGVSELAGAIGPGGGGCIQGGLRNLEATGLHNDAHIVTSRAGSLLPVKPQGLSLSDSFDDDDVMTLPDLDVTFDDDADGEDDPGLFKVCNRQKPVFKPVNC
ncbi:coiled-coil domain-containing protein 172-like isoform X1 [Littorina saxatilis]|uniref:Coiled-coil domain-containing protein 172 n=1 Tax=Littorina saxatilis TaxID=31220 RepID=A0AAN9BQ39_9CAEN